MADDALSGAELDVLMALRNRGPLDDGDVPSKTGRDGLVARGFVQRSNGRQWLTAAGLRAAVEHERAKGGA